MLLSTLHLPHTAAAPPQTKTNANGLGLSVVKGGTAPQKKPVAEKKDLSEETKAKRKAKFDLLKVRGRT